MYENKKLYVHEDELITCSEPLHPFFSIHLQCIILAVSDVLRIFKIFCITVTASTRSTKSDRGLHYTERQTGQAFYYG